MLSPDAQLQIVRYTRKGLWVKKHDGTDIWDKMQGSDKYISHSSIYKVLAYHQIPTNPNKRDVTHIDEVIRQLEDVVTYDPELKSYRQGQTPEGKGDITNSGYMAKKNGYKYSTNPFKYSRNYLKYVSLRTIAVLGWFKSLFTRKPKPVVNTEVEISNALILKPAEEELVTIFEQLVINQKLITKYKQEGDVLIKQFNRLVESVQTISTKEEWNKYPRTKSYEETFR